MCTSHWLCFLWMTPTHLPYTLHSVSQLLSTGHTSVSGVMSRKDTTPEAVHSLAISHHCPHIPSHIQFTPVTSHLHPLFYIFPPLHTHCIIFYRSQHILFYVFRPQPCHTWCCLQPCFLPRWGSGRVDQWEIWFTSDDTSWTGAVKCEAQFQK